MSDYARIYEERLRKNVAEVLRLDGLDVSPQWSKLLVEHDLEYWCTRISGITEMSAKKILAGQSAPSKGQILALPPIGENDYQPGVYYGLILSPYESATWGYGGSATKSGFGLAGRISQHSNPKYRASIKDQYKRDGRSAPLYYSLIDQPGKLRY